MQNNKPTKRLTIDNNYKRPEKTYQDTLTNKEIKEKLKDYKKCTDIKTVSIGTHLRYFSTNANKEKVFRLGGTLNKNDPEGKYVILGNGSLSWSVQTGGAVFWQKLSESELKEELKKEILLDDSKTITLENENKDLKKQLKSYSKKNDNLTKKIELLSAQLDKIATEIRKEKNK
jgi:hypothetical protein